MYTYRVKSLAAMQDETANVRNISIIAHVDHGKTTLMDCLLAYNGYVSRKEVGRVRLCDSRADERERQITMKSSSFSLHYANIQNNTDYLVNMMDSPGHLVFRSEVSYALRLTDGALLLIDIVDGVSAQTYTILKQAFDERIECVLVINKIDRLILDLHLSPMEAYRQISQTIDLVNAFLASLAHSNKD